jgi:segregation and condensation protein A
LAEAGQQTAGKAGNSKPIPMDKLWSDDSSERGVSEPELTVDVDGFEGPLDLLLHLARNQKVDLARISVLALAEQYLQFIERVRKMRLELAADYLVMAAWLAYLKSRLLIPKQKGDDEPSGEEMAALLQFRLKRLEAMRDAATRLVNRNRLGRDVFARGMPEPVVIERTSAYSATLYDLLTAYAAQRQRRAITNVQIAKRGVWSLKQAREILARLVGETSDWTALDRFLVAYLARPEERATAIASTFAASLELVREGALEIRQQEPFAPIYMRGGPKRSKEAETVA